MIRIVNLVHAQTNEGCGHNPSPGSQEFTSTGLSPTGTYKALAVFVRFQDDTSTGKPDWPLSRTTPPDYADNILSSSPTGPFHEASLTRYLHDQSLGNLTIYGDIYPNVIVTDNPEWDYHREFENGDPQNSGYGVLTQEILDKIDTLPALPMYPYGVDFSDYNVHDPTNNVIDYIFIIVRNNPEGRAEDVTFSGVSSLESETNFTLFDTRWPGGVRPTLVYDDVEVNWTLGSYIFHDRAGNQIPEIWFGRLFGHEFGHDIWTASILGTAHLRSWRPFPDNDVPADPDQRNSIAYAAMAGAGAANDFAGDETISAFERDLLGAGWISCSTLSTNSAFAVSVDDLYTQNTCRRILLDNDSSGRSIYVTNRQRVSYYDQLRDFTSGGNIGQEGLQTTGLLVGIRSGNTYEELPADNTLQSSIFTGPYQGDMYGPGTKIQITPWTRPNINGFTDYANAPSGFNTPSWRAIDNIRTGPGTLFYFDYYPDYRQSPTIREDSWIGAETAALTGTTLITNESVLTVESNLTIANLTIDPDAEIRVEPGVTVTVTGNLVIQTDGRLRVRPGGTLTHNGLNYLGTTVPANIDTYLSAEANTSNFGFGPDLFALATQAAPVKIAGLAETERSALMRWDVSSIASSTVTSVYLEIDVSNPTNTTGYDIYNLKKSWDETVATWRKATSTEDWDTYGAKGPGDRDGTSLGVLAPTAGGIYEVPLNDHGQSAVESWLASPTDNKGLIVAGKTSNINDDELSWDSKNHGGQSTPPTLEITYTEAAVGPVTADLNVFLMGPYSSGQMSTALQANGLVPTAQPYDAAPWNYTGNETATVPVDAVDWVLVELATGDPANPPLTIQARKAAFLKQDGTITRHNGSGTVEFGSILQSNYYVIVRHRNHLAIMSAQPVDFSSGSATHDFTTGLTQTYPGDPNIVSMSDLGGGHFGLWGGDGNANGSVTTFDYLQHWLPINGQSNLYDSGDFNMDGSGTSFDFLQIWLPSNGQASQVPSTTGGGSAPAMKAVASHTRSPIKAQLQTRELGRDEIELALSLKAEEALSLGTSTLWVSYDPRAVAFPYRPGAQQDYTFHAFSAARNAFYSSTVTHPLPGIISVNVALLEANRGSVVRTDTYEESLVLTFNVLDGARNPNFAWARCEVSDDNNQVLADGCSSLSDGLAGEGSFIGRLESEENSDVEGAIEIGEAYPNPFNPQSQFTLRLAREEHVQVDMYDITGRQVRMLHSGILNARETYRFTIDGSGLPSGTYFYRVAGEDFQEIRRVVLLK